MRHDLASLAEELGHLMADREPCCADCAEHPEEPPCCGPEEARVRRVRGAPVAPSKVSRVPRKGIRSSTLSR